MQVYSLWTWYSTLSQAIQSHEAFLIRKMWEAGLRNDVVKGQLLIDELCIRH